MKKQLRIGLDAKRAFCNTTGLGNYSRNAIRSLVKFHPEHQYFLFTPKITCKDFEAEIRAYQNITIIQPRGLAAVFHPLWRTWGLAKACKKYALDLFHGLSNEIPRNIPTSTKSVVTIHDLIFLHEKFYYSIFDIMFYHAKVKHATRKSDHIIAISAQTKDDVVALLHIAPEKISIAYQGLAPEFLTIPSEQTATEVKQRYQLPDAYILFVGRIEVRKNLQGLLQAISQLKNETSIPVVAVGRKTRFFKSLQDFIKINQLKERVIFPGSIAQQDLPALYKNATLVAYPSYREGFGLPILESIAMGTPIICSDGKCFTEAGGAFPRYFNPHEPAEIAAAIREVLATKKTFSSESIFEHLYPFAEHQVADRIMAVYKEMLDTTS